MSDRFLKRGGLIVDLQARRTTFTEREVQLPPAAFDYCWSSSPGTRPTSSTLSDAGDRGPGLSDRPARGPNWPSGTSTNCATSLEPDPGNPRHVVLNVRGVGYRLIVD